MTEAKYRITIAKNNGTNVVFGNISGTLLHVNKWNIKKDSRLGFAEIELDNLNGRYNDEFDSENGNDLSIEVSHDNGTTWFKRFGGESREVTPDQNNISRTLLCKDWNFWLSERAWTGSRTNIDLGELIYVIFNEKFPEFDLSQINRNIGINIDRFVSGANYVDTILDDLFQDSDYDLIVDANKVVRLFERNQGSSSMNFNTGDNGNVIEGTANLKKSSLTNKNSVTVIGGRELIQNEIDSFVFEGNRIFTLLNNPLSKPTLTKNGNAIPTDNFKTSTDFRVIEILSTESLSDGDVIVATYNHDIPVWYRENDLSATKLREFIIKDDTILSATRARNIARLTLKRLNIQVTKGSFVSDKVVNNFSYKETLNFNNVNGFTGEQLISGYNETFEGIYIVSFNVAQVLDENTRLIVNLVKKLDKTNSTTDIAEIVDGFNLLDKSQTNETITGVEFGVGTRWIINHPTNGAINSIYTLNTGESSNQPFDL